MVMSSVIPRTRSPCLLISTGPGTGITGSCPDTTLPWVASGSPVVVDAPTRAQPADRQYRAARRPRQREKRHELRRTDHSGDAARLPRGSAVLQGQEPVVPDLWGRQGLSDMRGMDEACRAAPIPGAGVAGTRLGETQRWP